MTEEDEETNVRTFYLFFMGIIVSTGIKCKTCYSDLRSVFSYKEYFKDY